MKKIRFCEQAAVSLIGAAIRIYQKTLSFDHGPLKFLYPRGYCRFYPSCSAYAAEAIKEYGLRGLFKAFWRILRCNPFSFGGIDKVK